MRSERRPGTAGGALACLLGLALSLVLSACARPAMMPGSADRGYIVYGYVTDAAGEPMKATYVYLYDAPRNELLSTVQTDTFGTYNFAYYPPGEYRVEVEQATRPFQIAGSDIQIDVQLGPGAIGP